MGLRNLATGIFSGDDNELIEVAAGQPAAIIKSLIFYNQSPTVWVRLGIKGPGGTTYWLYAFQVSNAQEVIKLFGKGLVIPAPSAGSSYLVAKEYGGATDIRYTIAGARKSGSHRSLGIYGTDLDETGVVGFNADTWTQLTAPGALQNFIVKLLTTMNDGAGGASVYLGIGPDGDDGSSVMEITRHQLTPPAGQLEDLDSGIVIDAGAALFGRVSVNGYQCYASFHGMRK